MASWQPSMRSARSSPLERLIVAGDLSLGELQDQALVGAARQLEQVEEQPALELPVQQALGAEGQADGAALFGALAQQAEGLFRHQPIQRQQQPRLLRHRHEYAGLQLPPLLVVDRISRSCCNTT